ncbi:hypothetical protein GCM10023079_05690 [Streptomyces chitinivorans]
MVERAFQPSPIWTWVRFGAALERETLPPLASVTPMLLILSRCDAPSVPGTPGAAYLPDTEVCGAGDCRDRVEPTGGRR